MQQSWHLLLYLLDIFHFIFFHTRPNLTLSHLASKAACHFTSKFSFGLYLFLLWRLYQGNLEWLLYSGEARSKWGWWNFFELYNPYVHSSYTIYFTSGLSNCPFSYYKFNWTTFFIRISGYLLADPTEWTRERSTCHIPPVRGKEALLWEPGCPQTTKLLSLATPLPKQHKIIQEEPFSVYLILPSGFSSVNTCCQSPNQPFHSCPSSPTCI